MLSMLNMLIRKKVLFLSGYSLF